MVRNTVRDLHRLAQPTCSAAHTVLPRSYCRGYTPDMCIQRPRGKPVSNALPIFRRRQSLKP